ncbi:MAG: HD domain-containing protein [Paludibacteraceae bacterium]|nr:HD domain-containing protein [Paludibacteraceae bacterium]
MTNKHKIINDPVFGFISIPDATVYDVLQHPFVQRLNRIRQLGLSYMVYPGAMHSRFLHSIGAMHLMQDAIAVLRGKDVPITDVEAIGAQIAILLHDIGHGPFSHVLEHTLVDGITHEDISLMMMEQIRRDLHQEDADSPISVAISIFRNEYHKHFLHELISSQLDVDRLDYLSRDSFFCGVTEGSVASARILKMLCVRNDKLAVEAKGIYSVEKFLIARRLMYWQVYLHKTSVAAEQLLIKILQRAKELAKHGVELFCPPALHYFLYQHITASDLANNPHRVLEQYALLDDSDILSSIKAWQSADDKVLALLSKAFTNRRLFKAKRLDGRLMPEQISSLRKEYSNQLAIDEKDANYFFMEHISSSSTYSDKDEAIDIAFNDGTVRNIAEVSELLNWEALTRRPEKLFLFYYR